LNLLLLGVNSIDHAGLADVSYRKESAPPAQLLGCCRVVSRGRGLYEHCPNYNIAAADSSWNFRSKRKHRWLKLVHR
jgi:hypothetical protein